MDFQLISDLHLEYGDLVLPGGDILLISGDVCEAKRVKKSTSILTEGKDLAEGKAFDKNRADRYYRFLLEECSMKYRHVFYVIGNHEAYSFKLHKAIPHLKKQLPDNIHILENERFDFEDVSILGCTLWTDMNKSDPLTLNRVRHAMNDYVHITMLNESGQYHKLTPEHTVKLHHASVDYLKKTVEAEPDRKFIIMTHHAPTKLSTKPRYEDDYQINGAYSSDLSEFILDHPQIIAMTHGHTHDKFQYQVGQTWVLCNPRGYNELEHIGTNYAPLNFLITEGKICL